MSTSKKRSNACCHDDRKTRNPGALDFPYCANSYGLCEDFRLQLGSEFFGHKYIGFLRFAGVHILNPDSGIAMFGLALEEAKT